MMAVSYDTGFSQNHLQDAHELHGSYYRPTGAHESWSDWADDKDMTPKCAVCDSPNASTLHFGGRSCKACAAFFRRTVSMNMTYQCIGTQANNSCRIHYELRMLCRQCRYVKCLHAGMKTELVQAKRDDVLPTGRGSRRPMRKSPKSVSVSSDQAPESRGTYRSRVVSAGAESYHPNFRPMTPLTPRSDPESEMIVVEVEDKVLLDYEVPTMLLSEECITPQHVIGIHPEHPPLSTFSESGGECLSLYENDACCSSTPSSYDEVYLRRGLSLEIEDDRMFSLLSHYVRMETSLNDRRKIMYTDTPIRDIFDVVCEVPFERRHLKPFNYRSFRGMVKHDFAMILDYVTHFPDFQVLNRTEKNVFYRMTCAVDSMISSAYYTYRLGMEESLLVLFNGDYIPMNPMPMSGEEPNAAEKFDNSADFTKYKTLMPMKLRQWQEMAVPFSALNISFDEFVLLKALTIWHISHYKLTEEGREVCARQRDAIINAMHRISVERGDCEPSERVGQLLLSMSYILEQVQALTSSYVMITFFDVLNCDSLMHDMLSFKY